MKKNQKLWNNKAKKVAYFLEDNGEYIKVKIDGLNTIVPKKIFDEFYEVIDV